jgi:hypothetical protein
MGVDVLLLLQLERRSGTFLFLIFIFYFLAEASLLTLGYCVVAKDRCN